MNSKELRLYKLFYDNFKVWQDQNLLPTKSSVCILQGRKVEVASGLLVADFHQKQSTYNVNA